MYNDSPLSSGYDHQELLEAECVFEGGLAYRERVSKRVQKKQESMTDYGKRLTATSVEPLSDAIKAWLGEAKGPGKSHIASKYLSVVDPDVAAFISLRCALDGVSTRKTLQNVAVTIGSRVEEEMRFTHFEDKAGGLWTVCNRMFDENSPEAFNSRKRRRMLLKAMEKFDVTVATWSRNDKFHVGMKLLDLLIASTGILQTVRSEEYRNTTVYLEGTPALKEYLDKWKDRGEVTHPYYQPMVMPPLPWSSPTGGGYVSLRLRTKLVQSSTAHFQTELAGADMPAVYQAVNSLQDTPWKINARVLAVAEEAWRLGLEVGDMVARYDIPKEPAPDFIKQGKAAWVAWKMKAGEQFRINKRNESKRVQVDRILGLANKFKEYAGIWFPVRLDFRGRMYYVPQYLNPQGNDVSKGLLTFAEGKPLGKTGMRWLMIHVANTFGVDKVSMADRVKWVAVNSERMEKVVEDPMADLWWTEADSPFQFLAAIFEYTAALEHGPEEYVCSLPIMVDGTCSGIQHFSAMLRDDVCGRHVNLVPQDKPADIYRAVAEKTEEILRLDCNDSVTFAKEWLEYGITRSLTKRPTMVLPYGGTLEAVKEYVSEFVEEEAEKERTRPGTGKSHPFDKLIHPVMYLSKVIWRAMDVVVVGPRKAMDWLKEASKIVAHENLPLNWSTPTGFLVQQRYMNMSKRRVETMLGDMVMKLALYDETDSLDRRKQGMAIAPNFVHSLDAAALMLTVNACRERGVTSFAAIHDSYGTLPADMDALSASLREVFVTMYSERDVLGEFRAELGRLPALSGKELPPLPDRGTLDITGVLRSDFFFA
jgi:DNA-directed RNA polymerase